MLVRGSVGPLAGGQVGTVMAVLRAAQDAGRELIVHVAETRPSLVGARVTAWELEQAEIAHTIVTDAAAGWLLEAGRAAIVLVGAERIAANGDVAADAGTYPLAVLAARHGVPFVVCAPLVAVDFDVADGRETAGGAGTGDGRHARRLDVARASGRGRAQPDHRRDARGARRGPGDRGRRPPGAVRPLDPRRVARAHGSTRHAPHRAATLDATDGPEAEATATEAPA